MERVERGLDFIGAERGERRRGAVLPSNIKGKTAAPDIRHPNP